MAPSSRRRRRRAAPAGGAALPEDAVYEILLRLPARDLCRLRAVCRPWRSLLSDPAFAAAHAARHPEPLIVVAGDEKSSTDDGVLFDIMDLSGNVVKRVFRRANKQAGYDEKMGPVQGGLVCLVERYRGRRCRVLDPATGAVRVLPEELAGEEAAAAAHRDPVTIRHYDCTFVLGQVAATGEYKVLRVINRFSYTSDLQEVFTLNNGGSHGRWRRIRTAPPPNVHLLMFGNVTINGIVYMLSCEFVQGKNCREDTVVPFDLESEEWMPTIRGPLSRRIEEDENDADLLNDIMEWGGERPLAVLNGCLVLSHHIIPSSMDLWFLVDMEKGLWVKKHRIQLHFNYWKGKKLVHPLFMLNDGRIVLICMGNKGLLKVYNPRTGTSTDVAEIGPCDAIGLYTGSLLSLASQSVR